MANFLGKTILLICEAAEQDMTLVTYDRRTISPLLKIWAEEGGDTGGLRKNRTPGKIVLPCKPKFPRRGKSFFQARFAADSIFGQVIPWTPR